MQTVTVREIEIGAGMPKICVPIIGKSAEEIARAAKEIRGEDADFVEWRADWFADVSNLQSVLETGRVLRKILGATPILFTFRTAKEGGERQISIEEYIGLNERMIESGLIDLVDVELFCGDETVKRLIETAHENGVKVIVSNHDFEKTPPQEEIVGRLRNMQSLGADISKIAVMPQCRRDVVTLLAATEEMNTEYAQRPIITMSMGAYGVISRISGETFGSAVTFGAVGKTSAPGQLEAERLKNVLKALHGE